MVNVVVYSDRCIDILCHYMDNTDADIVLCFKQIPLFKYNQIN